MTAPASSSDVVLDLVKLRRKVSIVLPVGKTFAVAGYSAVGMATLRAYEAETDPARKFDLKLELVLLALPGATQEDLEGTGPEDWDQIMVAALGRVTLIEVALGNGRGAEEAPPAPDTTDSTTTTPTPASSPA